MFELQSETLYMEDVVLTAIQLNDLVVVQELVHASGTFETWLQVQILKILLFIFKENTLGVILFIASIEEIIPFENFI